MYVMADFTIVLRRKKCYNISYIKFRTIITGEIFAGMKKWIIGDPDPKISGKISSGSDLTPLCAEVLVSRGITDLKAAAELIRAESLESPFQIKDMEKAAEELGNESGCAVLLKGGHSIEDASDVLYENGKFTWFEGKRIESSNTHGTGCTLSSAIASNLALGLSLEDAIRNAKAYISDAIASGLNLGKGSGPLDHMVNL